MQQGRVDALERGLQIPGLGSGPFTAGQQLAAAELRLQGANNGRAIAPFALAVQPLQRQPLLVPWAGQPIGQLQLQQPAGAGSRRRAFDRVHAGVAGQQGLRRARPQCGEVQIMKDRIGLRQGLGGPRRDAGRGAGASWLSGFCSAGGGWRSCLQFGFYQQLGERAAGRGLECQRHGRFAVGQGDGQGARQRCVQRKRAARRHHSAAAVTAAGQLCAEQVKLMLQSVELVAPGNARGGKCYRPGPAQLAD